MSKENEKIVEMEALESVCEEEVEETVVEESKMKKVWRKIKQPAIIIGSIGAGVIAGLLLAGGKGSDENYDSVDVDVEVSDEE